MIVRVKPLRANWWVKSKIGSMWPCAGNGNIRMCGFLMLMLDMAFTRKEWWREKTGEAFFSFVVKVSKCPGTALGELTCEL